jgi:hypothetical protein
MVKPPVKPWSNLAASAHELLQASRLHQLLQHRLRIRPAHALQHACQVSATRHHATLLFFLLFDFNLLLTTLAGAQTAAA